MDLYSKVCRRLRYWVFPDTWPTKPIDLLTFAHVEVLKFLPYIAAFNNMVKFRDDLDYNLYLLDEDYKWLHANLSLLTQRIHLWLTRMPLLGQIYYGSYTSTNRRFVNIWDFTPTSIINNFGLANQKGLDILEYLKIFSTYIGNPLATVERREVKNNVAHVLCIPKEVISFGF